MGKVRKLHVQLVLGEALFRGDALILKLDIEIPRLEDVLERLGPLPCPRDIALAQTPGDDAGDAGARRDDALRMLLDHIERRAGLVIVIVHMRLGHEMQQIVIALGVLGEHDHVIERRALLRAYLGIFGEIDLAAVDGLDLLARFPLDCRAGVAQLGHAAHHAVVGDGDGGHIEVGRATHHVLHVRGAVEHRILGVIMQVDERHGSPFMRVRARFPAVLAGLDACHMLGFFDAPMIPARRFRNGSGSLVPEAP